MSIKTRFCAKCGKETDLTLDSLCAEDYLEENPIKLPKRVEVRVCKKCESVYDKTWLDSEYSPEYHLTLKLIEAIQLPENVSLEDVEVLETGKQTGRIKVTLSLLGKEIVREYNIPLIIKHVKCPNCSKPKQSHRAILQLRRKQDPENFVKDIMEILEKKKIKVIKIKRFPTGLDIFLATRQESLSLSKIIRSRFQCTMSESAKASGWSKMKDKPLYISTIILRCDKED